MKLTAALEKKFNAQVTLEFEASIVYRQLAIEMEIRDFPGMATWLRNQSSEELVHATKLIDHLSARDNHPKIGPVAAPSAKVTSPLDCFRAAFAHEQRVSESIRDLYRACEKAGDLDSRPLLDWFLNEQIEEEHTVSEIVSHLELIQDDGPGLLRLDEDLGQRPATRTTG